MKTDKFSNPDDPREYCREPFMLNNRLTAATNGHILISWPGTGAEDLAGKTVKSKILIMLAAATAGKYKSLAAVELPKKTICFACSGGGKSMYKLCDKCDGEGECNTCGAECDKCNGTNEIILIGGDEDCPDCGGAGDYYPIRVVVTVCGVILNPNYLEILCAEDGVEIAKHPDMDALMFKCGEYLGLMMGCRK